MLFPKAPMGGNAYEASPSASGPHLAEERVQVKGERVLEVCR